jgi:hypothetical protein
VGIGDDVARILGGGLHPAELRHIRQRVPVQQALQVLGGGLCARNGQSACIEWVLLGRS